jgi:hypothetical protein
VNYIFFLIQIVISKTVLHRKNKIKIHCCLRRQIMGETLKSMIRQGCCTMLHPYLPRNLKSNIISAPRRIANCLRSNTILSFPPASLISTCRWNSVDFFNLVFLCNLAPIAHGVTLPFVYFVIFLFICPVQVAPYFQFALLGWAQCLRESHANGYRSTRKIGVIWGRSVLLFQAFKKTHPISTYTRSLCCL